MAKGRVAHTTANSRYGDEDDDFSDYSETHDNHLERARKTRRLSAQVRKHEVDAFSAEELKHWPMEKRVWVMVLVTLSVIGNVVMVLAEVDYGCPIVNCSAEERGAWIISDYVFGFAFVLEAIMRISSRGPLLYFTGRVYSRRCHPDSINYLGIFDLAIVALRLYDPIFMGGTSFPFKFVSTVRIVQIFPIIHEFAPYKLRKAGSLTTAVCTAGTTMASNVSAILCIITLVLAIIMTDLIGRSDDGDNVQYEDGEMSTDDYWGSVPRSALTLVQALSGDGRWAEIIGPVSKQFLWFAYLMGGFVVIGEFVFLTAILAYFIRVALKREKDFEYETKRERLIWEQREIIGRLKQVIEEADTDSSGKLDKGELLNAMETDGVAARLDVMGLKPPDLVALFDLQAQYGGSVGEVKTSKFITGCLRMIGPAMAADTYSAQMELKRCTNLVGDNNSIAEAVNDTISHVLRSMTFLELVVMKMPGDHMDPVHAARKWHLPAGGRAGVHKPPVRPETASTVCVPAPAPLRPFSAGGSDVPAPPLGEPSEYYQALALVQVPPPIPRRHRPPARRRLVDTVVHPRQGAFTQSLATSRQQSADPDALALMISTGRADPTSAEGS